MTYTRIDRCRVCESSDLTEVLSLGEQFLASSFVKSNTDNPLAATRFPLTLVLCDRTKNPKGCGVLQLQETVKRDLLYRKYFYRSATNPMMHSALSEIAQELMARIPFAEGDAVLDIGCNDGTMLSFFPASLRRFGIDPAENISPLKGIDPSIKIRTDYFSKSVAQEMISRPAAEIASAQQHGTRGTMSQGVHALNEPQNRQRDGNVGSGTFRCRCCLPQLPNHGTASHCRCCVRGAEHCPTGSMHSTSGNVGSETFKAIASIAMFYDLDDPHAFVQDVKTLLHPEGIWCIQLSWLYDVIRNMNFFDICHEHLLYYSLGTLRALLHLHDLEIIDASTNPVNGGSLRVFVRHKKAGIPISPNVQKILDEEAAFGLNEPADTFHEFGKKISDLKKNIVGYLRKEKERGGTIVGLGASTKGNVLLQYFGIGKELMPYLCDRNPEKIGLRTLGTDIEVISEERMREMRPSCLLVLIWFFRDELLRREREYLEKGGVMLFPMPHPTIVTKDGETPLSPPASATQ